MRTSKLEDLSNDELAERFKQLSFQQADAETGNDMRTYNQRSHQLKDIAAELTRRGPEARRALIALLDATAGPWRLSATAQCRYNAAWELLAIEPARARAALDLHAAGRLQFSAHSCEALVARIIRSVRGATSVVLALRRFS